MIISKDTFTNEALGLMEYEKAYDKEFLAKDVARSLSRKLYEELGGVRAMSLIELDYLDKAFYKIGLSLIDWQRCNRKASPQEYADQIKDGGWIERAW